jgi:hypothetical protein
MVRALVSSRSGNRGSDATAAGTSAGRAGAVVATAGAVVFLAGVRLAGVVFFAGVRFVAGVGPWSWVQRPGEPRLVRCQQT